VIRLCVAGFVAYCSYAMCRTPLLPLFARDLGASPATIGVVVAASTITGALLKLPAGVWSDMLGRRPLLLAAAAVFAVVPFSYLAVTGLAGLVGIRFLHGSATAIMGPVMSATISDLAPPSRRATWLSTYATVQGAGQALAPIIAGAMIARGRYDLAFLIAGVTGLCAPLLLARVRLPGVDGQHGTRASKRFVDGIADVLRERRIVIASVTHAVYYVMHGTLTAFLPLYAQEQMGFTAVQIGWLFGMQTVTTLAMRPAIGAASDRLGRRGAIVAGLATCAGGVFGVTSATVAFEIYAAVLIYAVGVAITTAATSAYVTDVAPRARFGAAHGVFGTIYDIGDAGGPLLAGILISAVGYTSTFRLVAIIAVVTGVLFLGLTRPAAPAS
jgi:MFS family permease